MLNLLMAMGDIITIAVAAGIVVICLIVAIAGGIRSKRNPKAEKAVPAVKEEKPAEGETQSAAEKNGDAVSDGAQPEETAEEKANEEAEEAVEDAILAAEEPEEMVEETVVEEELAPVEESEPEKETAEEKANEEAEEAVENAILAAKEPEEMVEETVVEEELAPVEESEASEKQTAEEKEKGTSEKQPAAENKLSEEKSERELTTAELFSGKFLVTYDRSFKARLIQSVKEVQDYYTELKNYLLSYKKMTARISWGAESFRIGRKLYAKMTVRGKMIQLFLAVDPAEYADTKYHGTDVKDSAKYEEVPFKFEVRSERKLGYAKDLIADMLADVPQGDIPTVDYHEEYRDTDALLEEGLVKLKKISRGDMENKEITPVNIADLIRNKISIGEADTAVSDDVAVTFIEMKEGENVGGKKAIVNLDTISANFEAGDVVTVDKLKEKKLVPANAGFVKVLARGSIDKPLTVEANDYSLAAVKMLVLTGGKAVQVK